jgi:hypothetical protein
LPAADTISRGGNALSFSYARFALDAGEVDLLRLIFLATLLEDEVSAHEV